MAKTSRTRAKTKTSAGLVMYRMRGGQLEMLLVHLGGPFWAKKDAGAWFIPKGGIEPGEDELAAAEREFQEELGIKPSGQGMYVPLGRVKHKSGKTVVAWAFEGDWDPSKLNNDTFAIEWPPRSGKQQKFPEVDRAAFFSLGAAEAKIHPAEFELLQRLQTILAGGLRES
jgi:predicted NUDIX family NTP pyrophosphohydrolase